MSTENQPSRKPSPSPLREGMVFTDTRHSNSDTGRYTVIFVDDQSVVLESPTGGRNITDRDQFEDARDNRWKQLTQLSSQTRGETGEDSPSDDEAADTVAPAVAVRSALTLKRRSTASDTVGSTQLELSLTEIEQQLEPGCLAPVDLTSVSGIGEATASNLRAHDVTTTLDVRLASDQYLTQVRGIGEQTVENLRDSVDVSSSD